MRWAALVLLLTSTLAPTALAAPHISGFAFDIASGGDDDAIAIHNPDADAWDLSDGRLVDNSGELRFPAGSILPAMSTIVVALGADAYEAAAGATADFAADHDDETSRVAIARGFALSQDGDRIALLDGEAVLDEVLYGDTSASGAEWEGSPVDTSGGTFLRWFERAAADSMDAQAWHQTRRAHLGEHLAPPATANVEGRILAYTAPEQSRTIVTATLTAAQASIRLNVYQFRDLHLARTIADHMRATPGLRVDVILDESPVGESREELSERGHVIETLTAAGARVHFLSHERYAYDHAKYIVVDDAILLVQTENLVPSGIPYDATSGNRGWGLVVEDPMLATAAARVFDDDFALRPFGAREPTSEDAPTFPPPALGNDGPARRTDHAQLEGPAEATLLFTPFADPWAPDAILSTIDDATTELRVVQLDLAPRWRTVDGLRPNPYYEALVRAADRGVDVKILLDGHFLGDPGAQGDNEETVDLVAGLGRTNLQAALMTGEHVLHAKGLVADQRMVLVGSINWNANSVLQNREAALLLEHPGAAGFFLDAFDRDWADAHPTIIPHPGFATALMLVALAAAIRTVRRP